MAKRHKSEKHAPSRSKGAKVKKATKTPPVPTADPKPAAEACTEVRFIEIVNWKKAQPKMKGNASWMKLYTSLLDNDAFCAMDDSARLLIIALWMYAARCGQYVFPADPKWLHRKIPLLNSVPDLEPLLEAEDIFGNPTPFVQYCDPPAAKKKRAAPKPAKDKSEKKQGEENRVEESRGEEKEKDLARKGVPSGNGREEEEEKRRVGTAQQNGADQSQSQSTPEQGTAEPAPADPTNPDALGRDKATSVAGPAPGSDNQPQPHRRRRKATSVPEYDKHDLRFGKRIFRALRLPLDPDDGAEGYSEVCSFASTWHKIRQQFSRAPPANNQLEMQLSNDQLGMRLLKEARSIAGRKSARNKSAVWNDSAPKIAASDK